MSADNLHALALVAVITGATLLTRALPFLVFGGKKTPPLSWPKTPGWSRNSTGNRKIWRYNRNENSQPAL